MVISFDIKTAEVESPYIFEFHRIDYFVEAIISS